VARPVDEPFAVRAYFLIRHYPLGEIQQDFLARGIDADPLIEDRGKLPHKHRFIRAAFGPAKLPFQTCDHARMEIAERRVPQQPGGGAP